MTITTKAARSSRTRALPTPAPPARLEVVPVLEHVYRVTGSDGTVGYIEQVGLVFVVLAGPVYNTSIEVAQCLDLDQALEHLR